MEEEVELEAEVEGNAGAGCWKAKGKGSKGRQVSSLLLKEMPLAVYQSRA